MVRSRWSGQIWLNRLTSVYFFQYSLYAKKESAHEDSIWTCVWGTRRIRKKVSKKKAEPEGEEAAEKPQEETQEEEEQEEVVEESQIVVTGGVDDLVKIWAYDEGALHLRHKLADHSLGVVSVALSKDADRKKIKKNKHFLNMFIDFRFSLVLASSSLDAAIHLWNVDTGEKIRTFDNGPMDAWTVAFSPCATKLISGSHAGKINLFSTETGVKEQSLDTRGKFTLSIAYVRSPMNTISAGSD